MQDRAALLVNAEVDSMGGVIDGVRGIDIKPTSCLEEIENAQEEIRMEIDCREERLRELEFLEKGGDPLDFKFGHAISVSVQSTSLTDQHPEQVITSKVKDACPLPALWPQNGDSESISKLGNTTCEVNSGDNLQLLNVENKLYREKNSKNRVNKTSVQPSEFSTRTGGNHKAKGSENSAIFRPYARRNRSKSNRDGARSASMDVAHARNSQASTHFQQGTRETKGSLSDANSQKDQKLSPICKIKSANRASDREAKFDNLPAVETVEMPPEGKLLNADSSGIQELAEESKTNGDSLTGKKDCEQSAEDISGAVGVDVLDPRALASCGSLPSEPVTNLQQTGIDNQPEVFKEFQKKNTQNGEEIGGPDVPVNMGCESSKIEGDKHADPMTQDSIENRLEQTALLKEASNLPPEDAIDVTNKPKRVDHGSSLHDNESSPDIKVKEDPDLQNGSETPESLISTQPNNLVASEADKNQDSAIGNLSNSEIGDTVKDQLSSKATVQMTSDVTLSGRGAVKKEAPDANGCSSKKTVVRNEDSILAEARIIQAKRKQISDLYMANLPLENRPKSHWDFVLEEMTWLANDFMQERLWKSSAAAQISRQTVLASHLRKKKQMPGRRLKSIAFSLAKSVMEFWHTAELMVNDKSDSNNRVIASIIGGSTATEDQMASIRGGAAVLDPQSSCNCLAIRSYSLRFLKYNSSSVPSMESEHPATLIDFHDLGINETSGESCITEDDLFYPIPDGAMERYRISIESYINGSIYKDGDTPMYDANEDMSQEKNYDEDEGETSAQYLPGALEWNKASKFSQKKQKILKRTYTSGSYELGADLAYGNHTSGTQHSIVMVKGDGSQNIVSIPIKRMRTASRQRVLGPSNGAGIMNMQAMHKADASSGDTNSCQDDQSSQHGGSQIQRSLEVESPVDFDKYLPSDSGEISTKHKKKKKKLTNASHEERWQHDSAVPDKQGAHSKSRLDSFLFDSNGSNGLFGQHRNKKLKVSKQSLENVFDSGAPTPNMSNPNEYKKLIANRDRLRKAKGTKVPLLAGSGSGWSSFEDQALVVLVHDMGPNWELVSDAINSTLQFKRIFRGPKECKERHKALMDQTAGDGADSAEDSGSSQPYPSTMPGIPKGSARQLFQRLHGPMEEDTVKSHFEKIIMMGQRQHHRRKQGDFYDQKTIVPPHNSHVVALSQVCPNNMNTGFFTPLDLIDVIMSSADALALGYQCPQTNAFANQSCGPSLLPPPGANSMYQGSVSNNLSSPTGHPSHRNGRYGVSRTSLPIEDQQRVQHLNSMLSNRNVQQNTVAAPGPHPMADRFGAHKLQAGNGMGMMNGINNRGIPISRPGFPGLGSSPMLDSSAVLSSGIVGLPNPDMQSAIGSSQGHSMQRPTKSSQQIRPGQNLDHQRQLMVPEQQLRATQTNSHCISPINGLNTSFTSQAVPASGQPYSVLPQQKLQMPSQQSHDFNNPHHAHHSGPSQAIRAQHPAYSRLARERQLQMQQQQMMQQQQNGMPQPQQQLPISSLQNGPQVQTSSIPISHSSISPSSPATPIYPQLQHKHHLPPHGLSKDSSSAASSLSGQTAKQRQRQQQQSVKPQLAQHRQQVQTQQHGKLLKGAGKGNMLIPPNINVDQPLLNKQLQSSSPVSQTSEKSEALQMPQGQSLYSQNSVQASRPQNSSHSQLQQKLYSSSSPPSNQNQQVPPLLDNGIQSQDPSLLLVSSSNNSHMQAASVSHQKQAGHVQGNGLRGHRSRFENSDHLSQFDEHTANNGSLSVGDDTTVTPHACTDLKDDRTSLGATHWQAPELLHDSSMLNASSQSGSIASPPTKSSGNDFNLAVSPGLVRRQSSGGLTSSANSVGERWQQKSQLQHPLSPSSSQEQCPSQQ